MSDKPVLELLKPDVGTDNQRLFDEVRRALDEMQPRYAAHAIALVVSCEDGMTGTAYFGASTATLIGGLEALKYRLLAAEYSEH